MGYKVVCLFSFGKFKINLDLLAEEAVKMKKIDYIYCIVSLTINRLYFLVPMQLSLNFNLLS